MTLRNPWLAGVLLFVLALVVYAPALGCGFIWDDDTFLTNNPLIHAADGPYRFWFTTQAPDYFPLTSSLLWLEWRLWGGAAVGFHAVNAVLHALSAVLAWRVLRRLEIPGAWAAAALFAAHPVAVESVAWITERKNTLSFALYLGAALLYLRAEDGLAPRRSYMLSLVVYVLALLAKSAAVVLAPALLLVAWWRRRRIGAADVVRTTPFFLSALALGMTTLWFQSHNAIVDSVVREDSLASRIAIAGRAVWFYLGKALAPVRMSFVYPRWETGDVSPIAFAPLAGLVVLALVAWRARESWGRAALFALGYFVIALAPVLGLVDIYFMRYSLVADHWQYFALLGPIALVASAWAQYASRWDRTKWGPPAAVLVLALFCWKAWKQQAMYRDAESLWSATIDANPDAWIAHNNLGLIRTEQGRLDDAELCFERAVGAAPDSADARYNLAVTLMRMHRNEPAIEQLERVLALRPGHADARDRLGAAKLALGRVDAAIAEFEHALVLDPGRVASHVNLGAALFAARRFEEAREHFERALRIQPDHAEALSNLGSTLQELGRTEEAVESHRQAVRFAPQVAAHHFNLAASLAKLDRTDEAIEACEHALALDPKLDGARFLLAELLAKSGRSREAFEQYEKLLRVDPSAAHLFDAMEAVVKRCRDAALREELAGRLNAARSAFH